MNLAQVAVVVVAVAALATTVEKLDTCQENAQVADHQVLSSIIFSIYNIN